MAVNTSAQFSADVSHVIDHDTLEVAQRYLVLYQFADKKRLKKGQGTQWTATRFNRLPLPQGPLSEGVPPTGETLSISQETGVAIQWGDKVTFTDVAIVATQHDLLKEATDLLGMQVAEMKERNGFNAVNAGTQVNYVNSRGARASLVAGDVLDPATVNRTFQNMKQLGVPMWSGQTGHTIQRSISHGVQESERGPRNAAHLVAIGSTFAFGDLANNPTVVNAWSWSDINRLYINELGYWRGIHFVELNLLPSWTGWAQVNGANAVGSLASTTYYIQVTGWDNQNFYESQIYQVSAGVVVTTGGISLTTPATAGFTYAVYVGTSTSPMNLGLSAQGPSSGVFQGQAIMIPPSTAVTITGVGMFQIPAPAPQTGVTVYPCYIFGQRAFACLQLENISWTRLFEADKSDTNNQLRVIGWKLFEGWTIINQQFLARIELTASNSGTFG